MSAIPEDIATTTARLSEEVTRPFPGARKVYVAFAVADLPLNWLAALADGGRLVAPVGDTDEQWLTLVEKDGEAIHERRLGPVRYVGDRHPR